VLFILFESQTIQGNTKFSAKIVLPVSVDRTWEDTSLLYPNQYHTPEEVDTEFFQLNETAPDIFDLTVLGQSVKK
jgi:hypothetical protein